MSKIIFLCDACGKYFEGDEETHLCFFCGNDEIRKTNWENIPEQGGGNLS